MGNLQYDQSAKAEVSVKSLHGLMTFLQKYERKIATWPRNAANGEKPNDFHAHLQDIYTELWQLPPCAPLEPKAEKPEWTHKFENKKVISSEADGRLIYLELGPVFGEDYLDFNLSKKDVIAMAKHLELTPDDFLE